MPSSDASRNTLIVPATSVDVIFRPVAAQTGIPQGHGNAREQALAGVVFTRRLVRPPRRAPHPLCVTRSQALFPEREVPGYLRTRPTTMPGGACALYAPKGVITGLHARSVTRLRYPKGDPVRPRGIGSLALRNNDSGVYFRARGRRYCAHTKPAASATAVMIA
jgi:hypothetical protein